MPPEHHAKEITGKKRKKEKKRKYKKERGEGNSSAESRVCVNQHGGIVRGWTQEVQPAGQVKESSRRISSEVKELCITRKVVRYCI